MTLGLAKHPSIPYRLEHCPLGNPFQTLRHLEERLGLQFPVQHSGHHVVSVTEAQGGGSWVSGARSPPPRAGCVPGALHTIHAQHLLDQMCVLQANCYVIERISYLPREYWWCLRLQHLSCDNSQITVLILLPNSAMK